MEPPYTIVTPYKFTTHFIEIFVVETKRFRKKPANKRVLTYEKSDFAIALRFSQRKNRGCTQS